MKHHARQVEELQRQSRSGAEHNNESERAFRGTWSLLTFPKNPSCTCTDYWQAWHKPNAYYGIVNAHPLEVTTIRHRKPGCLKDKANIPHKGDSLSSGQNNHPNQNQLKPPETAQEKTHHSKAASLPCSATAPGSSSSDTAPLGR